MQKYLILICLSFISLPAVAQITNTNVKHYEGIEDETTYFLLSGESTYDELLTSVLDKHWHYNDYQVITTAQLADQRKKPRFIVGLMTVSFYYNNIKTSVEVVRMTLAEGFKFNRKGEFSSDNSLIGVQMDDFDEASITHAVKSIQKTVEFVLLYDRKMNVKFSKFLKKIDKLYARDIRNKTLYVVAEDMHDKVNSAIELKKYYKYPAKFVSRSELNDAIIKNQKDVVYMKMVQYKAYRLVLFFSAENGKLLAFDIMAGFNQRQIKKAVLKSV